MPSGGKSASMPEAAGKQVARPASRIATGSWQGILDGTVFWSVFQRLFYSLVTIGVGLTTAYICVFVLPHMATGLRAAPVVPGWPALNTALLNLHIIHALPPLLLGLFAFSATARRWSPQLHRRLGTVYCLCIWLSAVTGFLLALANEHGLVAKAGFGTLALAWFATTWLAYASARRRDFVAHRRWMFRSYAITLAVVTVRPMFLVDPPAGLDNGTWYQLITWLCWVPNVIVGELYLRLTDHSGRLCLPRLPRAGARPRRRAS